jgi:hypothetical protein
MRNSTPPNRNNTTNNKNDLRIIELAEEIERLSIELNQRISVAAEESRLTNTQTDLPTATRVSNTIVIPAEGENQQLQIGDTVEITNNYKGNYRRQGTITKVTKSQVAIKFPNSPSQIYKKKTNVRFISRNE